MSDFDVGRDGFMAAHIALTVGLMGKLKALGILSQDDITDITDLAMLGLEEQGLSDSVRQAAHNALSSFQALFLGKPYPTGG